VIAFTLAVGIGVLPVSVVAQVPRPLFRSGIELVALSVTVVDSRQQFVTDLNREDFEVLEDGATRELTFFGGATVPLDVIVLLDISSSMQFTFDVVANAAVGFVRTLRPGDRAAVLGFGSRVAMLQGFTRDAALLEGALRGAKTYGRTALHDALYIAAHELAGERQRYRQFRRQALVVLSDGYDTSSLVNGDEALDAMRRSGVVVFTISPVARREWGQLPLNQVREVVQGTYALRTLANETGGRAFSLEDLTQLSKVYADIAAEIQHQYTLAFEPRPHDRGPRFRRLLVRVRSRADVIVRTRQGYSSSR
jgi:Ca-activated chloride channel family protein